jgi:predicted DNA-binding transcriptional regulator AlpA
MNQDKAMPSKRTERDVGESKKSRAFEKRYISASELASRWSVSVSAIYRGNCSSHALSVIRLGGSVRFLLSEVEAFEREQEAKTRTPAV